MLAVKSLEAVSGDYVLDLSHLGVLSALMESLPVSSADKKKIIRCIGEKNAHGLRELCASLGADETVCEKLAALISAYGKPSLVLPKLRALNAGKAAEEAIDELEQITKTLEKVGYHAWEHAGYDFDKAIQRSFELAEKGGNVLLSPSCASFDMFTDYEARGRIFKEKVRALGKK